MSTSRPPTSLPSPTRPPSPTILPPPTCLPPPELTSLPPPTRLPSPAAARRRQRFAEKAAAAASAKRKLRRLTEAAAANEVKLQAHLRDRVASVGSRPTADLHRLLPSFGYVPLGSIAAGAFSTIFRCRDAATGSIVAVKSFDNLRCAKDAGAAEARDNELAVLRLLRDDASGCHPHIAHGLAEVGDASSPYRLAVLTYAEGGSLKRYLLRFEMAIPLVADATRQLASALAHLHSLDVAHRDLKPANILLAHGTVADGSPEALHAWQLKPSGAWHLKLCDFGFSCVCADRILKAHCGTPAYLAPEIASPADAHRGYLGRPVDLWALGCVVYEMLHRRPAFKCEERFELEGLIRRCNWGPISQRVPPSGRSLLAGLLVASPATRLTAQDVLTHTWMYAAATLSV